MPKDQWKRANDRKRFGPGGGSKPPSYKYHKPKGNRAKRLTGGPFVIPAGTPCRVSHRGGSWREHVTQLDNTFDRYTPVDNGGFWQFRNGDWLMRVLPKHVRR